VTYTVENLSDGMMSLPSLMKICKGVQAILSFRFSNLDDRNVGIIDGLGI
jgi:hypothetical protein